MESPSSDEPRGCVAILAMALVRGALFLRHHRSYSQKNCESTEKLRLVGNFRVCETECDHKEE
jgi:hypothetical protein